MDKSQKAFTIFKLFLSMQGIYLKESLESSIYNAYKMSLDVTYDNKDEYYVAINNTIKETEKLNNTNSNF